MKSIPDVLIANITALLSVEIGISSKPEVDPQNMLLSGCHKV